MLKKDLVDGLLIISGFIGGLLLVSQNYNNYNIPVISNMSSDSDSYVLSFNSSYDCFFNTSLPESVDCVLGYVSSFYKFNITDDNITLTFDELKSRGGDCKDWSEFYIQEFAKYNISGETIRFSTSRTKVNDKIIDNGHEFALVYNNHYYCVIDELNKYCMGLS